MAEEDVHGAEDSDDRQHKIERQVMAEEGRRQQRSPDGRYGARILLQDRVSIPAETNIVSTSHVSLAIHH